MDWYIEAQRFYPEIGKKIPITYLACECFTEDTVSRERLKLVLIRKGTAIIRQNDNMISIVAPAIFCVNEIETISMVGNIGWEASAFVFHPDFLNHEFTFDKLRENKESLEITQRQEAFLLDPFFERNDHYYGILNPDASLMNSITTLLDSIRSEIAEQSQRFWSCRARSYLIELLFSVTRLYHSPQVKLTDIISTKTKLVEDIILYLNANYANKITITQLCTLFGTNKTTIQQQFQAVTGQTIMSYLISLRVKLATFMLKDTGLTIEEIVERLGFSNSAHFNKMFKKLTGYSPSMYRKEFTWIGK